MGELKDLAAGVRPIHSRNIDVKTYPVEGGKVLVEGWLKDERHVDIYRHWDQGPRKQGPVHGLCARLLVGEFPVTILDAEAQMATVPNEMCPDIEGSIKAIVGTKIQAGYSDRIRELIGGVKGCAHLTHLVVVMGPAALHGFWTYYAQFKRQAPKSLEEVEGLQYLLNSCHLWTADGPLIQTLKDSIEKMAKHKKE